MKFKIVYKNINIFISAKYFLYISDSGNIIVYIMDTMDNLCTAKELAENGELLYEWLL